MVSHLDLTDFSRSGKVCSSAAAGSGDHKPNFKLKYGGFES